MQAKAKAQIAKEHKGRYCRSPLDFEMSKVSPYSLCRHLLP